MLLLMMLLSACRSTASNDSPLTNAASPISIEVVELAPSRYDPPGESHPRAGEAATCRAWTLDAREAAEFFRLSRPLAEGELHDFDWLPCSISGRLRAEGREWTFEINAGATSIWRGGGETRLLGCDRDGCGQYVILAPTDGP